MNHTAIHLKILIVLALLVPGCQHLFESPPISQQSENAEAAIPSVVPVSHTNIVRINKFFNEYPWLSFTNTGDAVVDGFKCTMYLESATSRNKGVFGDGTIVVSMYRLDPTRRGEKAVLAYEWEFPPDAAHKFQFKKETMLGWGYGLWLRWGKEVDVAGSKVAIVIRYIRNDGQVVHSPRKVFRVPSSGDDRSVITRRPSRSRRPNPAYRSIDTSRPRRGSGS